MDSTRLLTYTFLHPKCGRKMLKTILQNMFQYNAIHV